MILETVAAFIALEIASGFLKEHGKEIYHKAKDLLTPDEIITLNLLEKYPNSKELQGEVATSLETHLKSNPKIAKELEELIKQLPLSQVMRNTITQTGDSHIAVQDTKDSNININK
jgi:hypothetical protein